MKISYAAAAIAAFISCAAVSNAQNLVLNPGFETGDFADWTILQVGSDSPRIDSGDPHSGSFDLDFPGTDPTTPGIVSQNIVTQAGGLYNISFWTANDDIAPDELQAQFGGTTLVTLLNQNSFGYVLESFTNVPGTGTSTPLTFTGYQVPGHFYVDDVVVTAASPASAGTPEPGGIALLAGLGLTGALYTSRLRRRHKDS